MMPVPRDQVGEEPAEESSRQAPPERAHRPPMTYRIVLERDFLRAELAHRETVEEMRDFLRALARNSARCAVILIRVRASKPLFHVERDGLIEFLQQIARTPQHRIALLADTPDLQASHEYLELIARQRGVRVRTFRSEAEAVAWLKDQRIQETDRRQSGERRRSHELRPEIELRTRAERRRRDRRTRSPG